MRGSRLRVLRTRGPSVVYLDFGFLGGKGSDGERKGELVPSTSCGASQEK